ncbi:hypothetical protein SPRG_10907 [Saprolegnia parasitica CBS 223.65]|uniref:Uncharacterized protein n=1 Tax=Saprolegnia parasitica (strain CBS 223.65) TaxID=695850 RepID=A0A067C020_SAPPC|nr:hypothetical protein SPRG_10907 [Saprolegnia parasitica CBS 223.65]KDO24119.1 hypothetical protein SPRG_10907 [Saprolegnia parasitica CBS 223.65]|eukprot:XP_012205254.1 hypothetical protein SPRG_10907 [Saprolegnia parasitica CBS 223.65]
MTLIGAVFGAAMGLNTKLLSNALQKVPYMRHPWEHVAFIGIGAYVGHIVADNYETQVNDVVALRAMLGKPEERQ